MKAKNINIMGYSTRYLTNILEINKIGKNVTHQKIYKTISGDTIIFIYNVSPNSWFPLGLIYLFTDKAGKKFLTIIVGPSIAIFAMYQAVAPTIRRSSSPTIWKYQRLISAIPYPLVGFFNSTHPKTIVNPIYNIEYSLDLGA